MKRCFRDILKIAGAGAIVVSALMCLASLGLWVWSRKMDIISTENPSERWPLYKVGVQSGRLVFLKLTSRGGISGIGLPDGKRLVPWFHFNTYEVGSRLRPNAVKLTYFAIPLWFLAVLAAVPPFIVLMKRHRWFPAGHCHTCGYDLRATPERCPECGTAAESGG
jgi:hypothetical protein